jgi:molybdate transport system regulatory protein
MSEKSKPSPMRLRVSVWLENAEGLVLFGPGRLQILEAIDAHGSLSAAAEALGMSYRGLWARIRHSERRLGFPLVHAHAGRGAASGTSLTSEGRAMIDRFSQLRERVTAAADEAFAQVFPEGLT